MTTTATPSQSLLSVLGVLRRAEAPSDALPVGQSPTEVLPPLQQVFVNYIRRARVVSGQSYYVIPVLNRPCRTHRRVEGASLWVFSSQAAFGIGGVTAETIQQRGVYASRGTGVGTRATVAGLVPDGVASAILHYPAAPAHGPGHNAYPDTTLTSRVINNVVVFTSAPRGAGLGSRATVTWRAADGTVIKTITGGL